MFPRVPPTAINRTEASRLAKCSKPLEPATGLAKARRGVGAGFGLDIDWAKAVTERVRGKNTNAPQIAKLRKVRLKFLFIVRSLVTNSGFPPCAAPVIRRTPSG